MASGAGALGVALGGAAIYDGEVEQRPPLGAGRRRRRRRHRTAPGAWWLRTTLLWLGVVCLLAVSDHDRGAACLNTAATCATPRAL